MAFTLLLLATCHRIDDNVDSHPEHFDKVFLQAEQLKGMESEHVPAFLDSAFFYFPQPGTLDLYRKYTFLSLYFEDNKRDFLTALVYCDSALQVVHERISEKNYTAEYAKSLFKKGYLLIELKRYTEALDSYNQARQLIEKTKDSCSLSAYTFMLGRVCGLRDQNLYAARYIKKGIQELEHCNNNYDWFKLMVSKMDDAGIFYSRHGMPDSALYYFNAALDFTERHKNKYKTIANSKRFVELYSAVVYGNMGTAYLKKGDTVTAERLFLASLRVNTKKEYDQGDAQYTWLKLAGLYLAQKRLDGAHRMLKEMRFCLDTLPNLANEVQWYRLQFDYLNKTGQFDKVHHYIEPYLKVEDSLSRVKSVPQVDANKEYENLKSRYELTMLQKQDEVKSLYLVIVISFSLLAISVALFLWYNWERIKKLHSQVSDQNNHMQKALTALEQSQDENTRIMKIVAHDLRSPMAATISIAELLLDNGHLLPEDKEMLGLMRTSSLHSLDMITDLLNMNTTSEGLKKESVEMQTLLHYCVNLLKFKATEKKQEIQLETQQIVMTVNREKIWRVVSNLIVNAIKFSPEGSVIKVKMKQLGEMVQISIKDEGIGIPENLKDKIFAMFTDARRSGTSGEQSFGLGLAISRQIVEAHGGKIWFESNTDRGTTFFVDLPAI